jgi:hypothetical protein
LCGSAPGLQAENFLAVVPAVGNLVGGGTIDSKNNLDFKMAAALATSSVAGGAASPVAAGAGLLGQQSGGGCKSTSIPFLITGTTSDPKFAGAVPTGLPGKLSNTVDAIGGLFGGKKRP